MRTAKISNNHWGFGMEGVDNTTKPEDDFFQFANGRWNAENPIPADESKWGTFNLLRKKSIEDIHGVLEECLGKKAKSGSNLQKIRDYYKAAMDEAKLSEEGAGPLLKYFKMIDLLGSADDLVAFSAYLRTIGAGNLWRTEAGQDWKDRKVTALFLSQGGLSLPDRDYYLKDDEESKALRGKYVEHIKRMHSLAGFEVTSDLGDKLTGAIMEIETRLARASMTLVERRDLEKQYNKLEFSGLKALAPAINWEKYFAVIGIKNPKYIVVAQPEFIKEAGRMLEEISLEKWKVYLKWKIISVFAGYLSEEIVRADFDFNGKILSGMKEIKPRWKRVAADADDALGEALGELYVKKHFGKRAKRSINRLVDNLMAVYNERLATRDWMSEVTKKQALEKLYAFTRKLGYPDKWKNYRALKISQDSYLENHIRAYKFEFKRMMRRLGKRPDKKEWSMTPPTVNAYYNPLYCEIVFPAGIMQPPFFDPNADDAVNYGAIGWVIGHELTHGFDDKGSAFDKNGEIKNWWTEEDRELFEKKAEGLVEQFNSFEVLPGVFVNGKLTLGENIADLGGLIISYYAYQRSLHGKGRKKINGFTPEQRFFLGAAQVWRGHAREAEAKRLINIDPHSPMKARVNVPVSNLKEFYDAFGVKEGDGMFIPEDKRVAIW